MLNKIFCANAYLTVLLAATSMVGDYLVSHSKLHIFQAIFDNATHGIVGGVSWLLFRYNHRNHNSAQQTLAEIGICALLASLIDLDHFVAAKSVKLKEATNLKHRPFLHCSTYPLALCCLLLLLSRLTHQEILKKIGLLLLMAFASHHTRDATRRGYWLHPWGSTPPIPYAVYVGVTCLIPHLIGLLDRNLKIPHQSYRATVI